MLGQLITSKTRVRILMRLFLNPERQAYVRALADEFEVSPSQVQAEIKQLEDSGLVDSQKSGRQINYFANTRHALFPELQSMVRKSLGMDRIVDSIIERLGDVSLAMLIDDYAEGKDSGIIDLVLVGDIDQHNLQDLVAKTERYINRKIRTLVFSAEEYQRSRKMLLGKPHLVLLDQPVIADGKPG